MTPFQRKCVFAFLDTGRFAVIVIASFVSAFVLSRIFLLIVPLIDHDKPMSNRDVWVMFAVLGFWFLQSYCFWNAYFKAKINAGP